MEDSGQLELVPAGKQPKSRGVPRKYIFEFGARYGLLTLQEEVYEREGNRNQRYWICACDCGGTRKAQPKSIGRGLTLSCGCHQKAMASQFKRRHGLSHLSEYSIWKGMIRRCTDPRQHKYEHYGGRGISVCDRWRASFVDFLTDVGRRPSLAHSLDRYPDNDGDYRPGNVRWATDAEQGQNQRPRVSVTHCPNGHEFNTENTRWSKTGKRACKKCEAARKQRQYRERHGAVLCQSAGQRSEQRNE
jgi:hypothetical protein